MRFYFFDRLAYVIFRFAPIMISKRQCHKNGCRIQLQFFCCFVKTDIFDQSVIIVRVCGYDGSRSLFFRLCDVVAIKICGPGNDILISAFMVHLAFSEHKVRMDVGDCPVLNHFYKWAYTAIAALANQDELGASAHPGSCGFIPVMNDACSRRLDPATETADAVVDISVWHDYLIVAFDGKTQGRVKIFNVCDN